MMQLVVMHCPDQMMMGAEIAARSRFWTWIGAQREATRNYQSIVGTFAACWSVWVCHANIPEVLHNILQGVQVWAVEVYIVIVDL